MNWLDWLIILIVVLSAFQGLRYGLLASIARLAGILAGLGVAFTYHRTLYEYVTVQWDLEEKIFPLVKGVLKVWTPSSSDMPTVFSPGEVTASNLAVNQATSYVDYLAGVVAAGVLDALCFLTLLAATVWAVSLAGGILTKVADICLMGPLNRLGGLVFGAAKGLVVAMIVLTIMAPFQGSLKQTPESSSDIPGITSRQKGSFYDSKLLPYFEPLFNSINRPLPGSLPDNQEREGPAKMA